MLYSLLPVGLTVVLLGYTAVQVQQAQNQVQSLKQEAQTYSTQIESLKKNADTYKVQAQSLEVQVGSYKDQVTQLKAQLEEARKKLAAAVDLGQSGRRSPMARLSVASARCGACLRPRHLIWQTTGDRRRRQISPIITC